MVPEEIVTSDNILVLNEAKVPDASVAVLFKMVVVFIYSFILVLLFMCLLMVYALGAGYQN